MLALFKNLFQSTKGRAIVAGVLSVVVVAALGVGYWRLQMKKPDEAKPEAATSPTAAAAPAHTTAEPAKAETAQTEPVKTEPGKTETAKTEPVKTESAKTEAAPAHGKAPTEAKPAETPSPAVVEGPVVVPSFDVARVQPDGSALVAGRAAPNTGIDLLDAGKIIGHIVTNSVGQFVMLPKELSPGTHLLTLKITGGDADKSSEQNITVVIPKTKQDEVLVALTGPGQTTQVLSDPVPTPAAKTTTPAKEAAKAEVRVTIRVVEAGEGGALFASGTSNAGQAIQLYLSGTAIAKATTAEDGHWSLTVSKGMKPGSYLVRADALGVNGDVVARAEVPFDYPAEAIANAVAPETPVSAAATSETPVTSAPKPAEAAAAPPVTKAPVPTASDAVVKQLDTAIVTRGDSLWRISRKVYGHGVRYTQIYEANTKQIRDPKLIYPGQVFVLPPDGKN
eukprot:gene11855-11944_t